jgi:chaperone BCS1
MVDGNVSADMIANAITRANKDEKKESNAGITLSELLNLLDGVLEQPGRMIIITTNHVDRIDPALLRFGRVDLKIEFKLCSLSVVRDITRHFFDANGKDARPDGVALSDLDKVDLSDLDKVDLDDMGLDEMAPNDLAKYRGIAENRFSPSDVLETCFRSKSIDDAIRALIARSSPDPNKCDHIY